MIEELTPSEYVAKVEEALEEQADPERAEDKKEYMRNKFEFFGIDAQPRRKVTREFKRKENRPDHEDLERVIEELWKKPEREIQYFGSELVERYKKEFTEDIIELFEFMITNKSWWDTVDRIAKKSVGEYFRKYPERREEYIKKWLSSGDIWLQRTCLLFQLSYKEETDVDLLFDIIEELKDIDEFFIQKAIGWSLREYSRTEPELVEDFIKDHELSSLSTREGMKVINED